MSKPVEDWELSAFVDGDLPSRRMAEIEAEAERSPALRRHLSELLADHRLLGELGQTAVDPLSPALQELASTLEDEIAVAHARDRRPRTSTASRIWTQVAGLAAAAAFGWAAASWAMTHPDPLATFIDEATEAHRATVLAPAFSREASADAIASVGALFAHKLTPPDLTDAGFVLKRVDVASTDTGPAAVFFYMDPEARRLSLVLSLDTPILAALDSDGAAPRVTTHDGLAVAYGGADGVAYALIGAVPEPNARRLAARVATALQD